MINQQAIANITASFIPEYAEFVKGDFAATAASQFASEHQFTDFQREALQDGFTLYFLTVFSTGDLIDHLVTECDLPEEEAQLLVHAFLLTLPPEFPPLQEETKLALEALATPVTGPSLPINPAPQPANPSAHIRTMAADMTKSQTSGEKIYTSTQEAILREGWSTPKQTPPPNTSKTPPSTPPTPPTTGNWG